MAEYLIIKRVGVENYKKAVQEIKIILMHNKLPNVVPDFSLRDYRF